VVTAWLLGLIARFWSALVTTRRRSFVGLKSTPAFVLFSAGVNDVVPTARATPEVGLTM
jgi:hypothetical protein